MPATRVQTKSIHLIGGDDEFSIKETAAKLAEKLAPKNAGEFGVEIIEGDAPNQDTALRVLARVHEAVNTIGFFGGEKLVWLKSTELLADNPTTRAEAVKEALAEFAEQLKRGLPAGVTLLISAIGCDRRRSAYKTLEKIANVQLFEAPEAGKQAGEEEIAEFVQKKLRAEGKRWDGAGYQAFRELVEPGLREIANELEKLCLYVGKRSDIGEADVRAICSATRAAGDFELVNVLGNRNLPKAIRVLEKMLDEGEQAIGIVMRLVGQFRLMLLAKDFTVRKVLVPNDGHDAANEYGYAFQRMEKTQPQLVAHFPRTKEGKLPNAWRLYRCALAARNFSTAELISAMDLLLEANRQLVSTQLDARLVLEEMIAHIAAKRAA